MYQYKWDYINETGTMFTALHSLGKLQMGQITYRVTIHKAESLIGENTPAYRDPS